MLQLDRARLRQRGDRRIIRSRVVESSQAYSRFDYATRRKFLFLDIDQLGKGEREKDERKKGRRYF